MKRTLKLAGICMVTAAVIWMAGVISCKGKLRQEVIRLHVVAASDSEEDQRIKLMVRDAVVESLGQTLGQASDADRAQAYLGENLGNIETLANRVLADAGMEDTAAVSLGREPFPLRRYDTFSLPAGVYETLRITIGAGEGHNWWCVVFPALCAGKSAEEFENAASCAGMPRQLTGALAGEEGYEVRFLMLEALGKLENFLYGA